MSGVANGWEAFVKLVVDRLPVILCFRTLLPIRLNETECHQAFHQASNSATAGSMIRAKMESYHGFGKHRTRS